MGASILSLISFEKNMSASTKWTNLKLLCISQRIWKLLFLKDQRSGAHKFTSQSRHWHGDTRFSWLEDNDLSLRDRHCLFLTCSYGDNPILLAQYLC